MQLRKLTLHNYCQHRHREFDFHPGLNALIGPNGAGKTNTINGIVLALTGKTQNEGKKDDDVCQLAAEDEQSYVDLTLEHEGKVLDIRRNLRGSQTRLIVYDAAGTKLEETRGDTKVTPRIYDLLGTTERLITDYMFVARGELFKPFDPNIKPAERTVAFQRLFGTDKAEALWGAFTETFNAYPAIQAPDLTVLNASATDATIVVQGIDAQLALTADLEGWTPTTSGEQQIINAWSASQEASTARERANAGRRTLHPQRIAVRDEMEGLQRDIDTLSATLLELAPQLAAARKVLSDQQLSAAMANAVATQTARLAAAQAARNALVAPAPPAHGLSEDVLRAMLAETATAMVPDQQLLQAFGAGQTKCPTCGLEAVHLREHIPQAQARLQMAAMTQQNLSGQLNEAIAYSRACSAYAAEAARLDAQLVGTPAPEIPPAPSQDEITRSQTLVNVVDKSNADISGWRTALRGAEQRAATLEAQADTLRKQEHAAKRMVVGNIPTLAAVETARKTLADKTSRLMQRSQLLGSRAGALQVEATCQKQLQDGLAIAAAAELRTKVRAELEETRAALHRDALPKALTDWHLRNLGVATNSVLATFGTKFQLHSDGPLSYSATFSDGRVQRASRLSGGESVMMGLAFRIAVNSRFAGNLGLLCLDEPTAYLDRDNLGCLALALDCLRSFSQTHGLQTILITHENVGSMFDAVHQFS